MRRTLFGGPGPNRSLDVAAPVAEVTVPVRPRAQPSSLTWALRCLAGAALLTGYLLWALVREAGLPFGGLITAFIVDGVVYVLVGAWLWGRRPTNGLGLLLVIAGGELLVAMFANTGQRWLIPVGFLAAELPIAGLAHVVLAFPSGRLPDVRSRRLVTALYVSSVTWQLAMFPFAPESGAFPALHVDGDHTRLLERLDDAQSLVGGVIIAVAVVTMLRWLFTTRQRREQRVLALAFGYGIASLLSFPLSAQVFGPLLHWSPVTLAKVQIGIVFVLPLVLGAAALSGALARTRGLEELVSYASEANLDRASLAELLRSAVGDPSLQVLHEHATAGSFVDADGQPVELDPRRTALAIGQPPRRSLIVYDPDFVGRPDHIEAAARIAALAIDREHLTSELLASYDELRASRLRILEHGETQRRQLARDLHDGLQARLVLAAIRAGRLRAEVDGDERIAALHADLLAASHELRHIVEGVLPPILLEQGCFAAIEDLVEKLPLRVDSRVRPGSLAWPIAAAAYFVAAEAISNVAKHSEATAVRVDVGIDGDQLHLTIVDNGRGGAKPSGRGMRGMVDRIATLDGTFRLSSPPGAGTAIAVTLPTMTPPTMTPPTDGGAEEPPAAPGSAAGTDVQVDPAWQLHPAAS